MTETLTRLGFIERGLIRIIKNNKEHEYVMSRKYAEATLVLVRELKELIQKEGTNED